MVHKKRTDWTELIDADDDEVAQDEWSDSVALSLDPENPGVKLCNVMLYQTWDTGASGAAQALTGWLVFFDADPGIAAGEAVASVENAQLSKIIGRVPLAAADWDTFTVSGQVAVLSAELDGEIIVPPGLKTIYVALFQTSANPMNSAADDDEELYIACTYG